MDETAYREIIASEVAPDVNGQAVDTEQNAQAVKPVFTNKEISWLSFNDRVLQEAADPSVPLMERIKFLGIFSSNQDEFFRVRVATLKRLLKFGKKARSLIGHHPKDVLEVIQKIVVTQHKRFNSIYQDILTELANHNIYIINERQLTKDQAEWVRNYFRQRVRPKLIPLMIDQVSEMPELHDQSIYLAVSLAKHKKSKRHNYALIEVPTETNPRFVILPQEGKDRYIILLDDVIRRCLGDVFHVFHYNHFEAYTVKLTRDAELDLDNDLWDSYIKKISKSLKQRKEGNPTRFIYDETIPQQMLKVIQRKLKLGRDATLIPGGRYHNFKDFMKFPDFGIDKLRYEPIETLPHKAIPRSKRIMETMRKRDVMLHYPYQSFNYLLDLLREASIDPKVTSIKMVIYRAARDSAVINALINAARNGKSVVAVLELQARFDEEANIYWGNRLKEEDVQVIYGVPGLKVHSKLALITRKEKGGPGRYAIIGTGNFNEDTARIYGDHALFTSDKRLTRDVHNVFRFYESNYKVTTFNHLLVSPFNMRKKFMKLIQTEIDNAQKGRPAWMNIKLNNLADMDVIRALYRASQAGVKIKLNVRSMFSLVPGIEGLSDNIEATAIVDKFLEHSRIFIFCNGGDPKYFIGSADWMNRNLDRRVEVVAPIYDKSIQLDLQRYFDLQWHDNVKSRILNAPLDNQFRESDTNQPLRAQWAIYDYLKKQLNQTRLTGRHKS